MTRWITDNVAMTERLQQLLDRAAPSNSRNRFGLDELKNWAVEYLADYDDEVSRFPKLSHAPHWTLWLADWDRTKDGFFAVLVFRADGVEVMCGTGECEAVRTFGDNFLGDPDQVREAMVQQFHVEESVVVPRDLAERWLGRPFPPLPVSEMNETQWQSSKDSQAMLVFLRSGATFTERKARLFGIACVRRVLPLLTDESAQRTVKLAEEQVESRISWKEFIEGTEDTRTGWASLAATCLRQRLVPEVTEANFFAVAARAADQEEERAVQASLLRDIFGPLPFRPIHISPLLLTSTVLALAQSAYDERHMPSGVLDNQRLAVLADALCEAGCTDQEIADHLRGPQAVHVRGCWVVDVILGKS